MNDCDHSDQLTEEDIEGASLNGRKPTQLTMQELKFWLSWRQVNTKKLKTKSEIVLRVQEILETTDYKKVVDPTKDQTYRKRKFGEQQALVDIQVDAGDSGEESLIPPSSGWTKSFQLASLANVCDVHIREYCLHSGKRAFQTSSQPRKKTCIRPETRGYQFFIEGYLHDIWTSPKASHIFVKSRCFPSQKKNDEPHKLWYVIAVKFVKSSMTTIPDDLSKTSLPQSLHKPRVEGVAAEVIMHVVNRNHTAEKQLGTCTLYEARRHDAICNDGELLRDVQRTLVAENPLYGITYMASADTSSTVYCPTRVGPYVPRGSVLSYQLSLTEGNFSVDCHTLSLNRFRCKNSCVVREVDFPSLPMGTMEEYHISDSLPSNLRDKLQSRVLTKHQIEDIELQTRNQASSDLWWKEREFRLTASTFAEIVRRKKQNCEKFVSRLQKKQPENNTTYKIPLSIKHGKDHENVAVGKYHRYMCNIGHKVQIYTSGLIVRQDLPFLGCTPDRKVIDPISHPHHGIVEVKCPYTVRGITPKEAASINKDCCLQKSPTGYLSLKHSHPYYQQIQGQMGVTGVEWCDFVVYTFKGLFVERVPFNADFWKQMKETLEQFYFSKYLPIVLSVKS